MSMNTMPHALQARSRVASSRNLLVLTGIRGRVVAAALAVVAAVGLPQLFHVAGMAAGAGPAFAQSWLPMFLPVLVVGLLSGPAVGAIVGVLSPLVAFALTGMPAVTMLPAMTVWLAVGGLVAGLVATRRWNAVMSTALVVLTIPVVSFLWMVAAAMITGAGIGVGAGAWLAYWLTGLAGFVLEVAVVGVLAVVLRRR